MAGIKELTAEALVANAKNMDESEEGVAEALVDALEDALLEKNTGLKRERLLDKAAEFWKEYLQEEINARISAGKEEGTRSFDESDVAGYILGDNENLEKLAFAFVYKVLGKKK